MVTYLSDLFDIITVFFTDTFINDDFFAGLCVLSVCFTVIYYFMWFWEH